MYLKGTFICIPEKHAFKKKTATQDYYGTFLVFSPEFFAIADPQPAVGVFAQYGPDLDPLPTFPDLPEPIWLECIKTVAMNRLLTAI